MKCRTAWVCTEGLDCCPHPSLLAGTKWEAASIVCDCRVMRGPGLCPSPAVSLHLQRTRSFCISQTDAGRG